MALRSRNSSRSSRNKQTVNISWIFLLLLIGSSTSSSSSGTSWVGEEANFNIQQDTAWKWRPEVPHPCTVHRMTMHELQEQFATNNGLIPALYQHPVVIRADRPHNANFRRMTTEDQLVSHFVSGFQVTLSSSNSFSQHRRTIPLEQYLAEMRDNHGTTSPHQLSNHSWYLFGETFSEEWKAVLQSYQLPPCVTCTTDYAALSFGIGNRGSGVQWHIHGPGFSEALHGRKHWILYPPHYPPPHFHHDQSTRNWMEFIYTNRTLLQHEYNHYLQQQQQQQQQGNEKDNNNNNNNNNHDQNYPILNNGRPYECTLEPGELIYFPDRWYHATINCDPYTAFVSTFTSDHLFIQDQQRQQKQHHEQQHATSSSFLDYSGTRNRQLIDSEL